MKIKKYLEIHLDKKLALNELQIYLIKHSLKDIHNQNLVDFLHNHLLILQKNQILLQRP